MSEGNQDHNLLNQLILIDQKSNLFSNGGSLCDSYPFFIFNDSECSINTNEVSNHTSKLFKNFHNIALKGEWESESSSFFAYSPLLPTGKRIRGISGFDLSLQFFINKKPIDDTFFNTVSGWKSLNREFNYADINASNILSWSGFFYDPEALENSESSNDYERDVEDPSLVYTTCNLKIYSGRYSVDSLKKEPVVSDNFIQYIKSKIKNTDYSDNSALEILLDEFHQKSNVKAYKQSFSNLISSINYIFLIVACWELGFSYKTFKESLNSKTKYDLIHEEDFLNILRLITLFFFDLRCNKLKEFSIADDDLYQISKQQKIKYLNFFEKSKNIESEQNYSDDLPQLSPTESFITDSTGVKPNKVIPVDRKIVNEKPIDEHENTFSPLEEHIVTNPFSIDKYSNNIEFNEYQYISEYIFFYWNFYLYAFLGEDYLSQKPINLDWNIYQNLNVYLETELTQDYLKTFELNYKELFLMKVKQESFLLFTKTLLKFHKTSDSVFDFINQDSSSQQDMNFSLSIVEKLKSLTFPPISAEEMDLIRRKNEKEQKKHLHHILLINTQFVSKHIEKVVIKFLSSNALQKNESGFYGDVYDKNTVVLNYVRWRRF